MGKRRREVPHVHVDGKKFRDEKKFLPRARGVWVKRIVRAVWKEMSGDCCVWYVCYRPSSVFVALLAVFTAHLALLGVPAMLWSLCLCVTLLHLRLIWAPARTSRHRVSRFALRPVRV